VTAAAAKAAPDRAAAAKAPSARPAAAKAPSVTRTTAKRPLRIATWNINSIRLRQGLLQDLVAALEPDVLCLQETKCPQGQASRTRRSAA
jgi:hypothetical protein